MTWPRRRRDPARRVAVIGPADERRRQLVRDIRRSGFHVHECDELGVPTAFVALVVLGESSSTLPHVRMWLRMTKRQCLVVITPDPAAFHDLLVVHPERLFALPTTAPGRQVVDLVRAAGRPSGSGSEEGS